MSGNPNQILAKRLRSARESSGWAQEKLAERSGLHRTYVGAIERGERNVTLNTLFAVGIALGIEPAELISENQHVAIKQG